MKLYFLPWQKEHVSEDEIEELIDDGTSCRSIKTVDLEDLGQVLTKRNLKVFDSYLTKSLQLEFRLLNQNSITKTL